MSVRKPKRSQPIARCACGERLTATTVDALNAKLVKHYKVCPKP